MRRIMLALAVTTAGLLSYWPFSNAMSCWTAANEIRNKEATVEYAKRVGGKFGMVNSYLLRSDFSLRNFSSKEGLKTFVYVTNNRNIYCWYTNIVSVDGSIVRLDVDEKDGIDNQVVSIH